MKEKYIASVDLGSSKLGFAVAKVTGKNVQAIYYAERPSAGIKYGRIFNPHQASLVLKQVAVQAENELGIKLPKVVVNMPRYGVIQVEDVSSLEREDASSCIQQEEIEVLKQQALNNYPLENQDKLMIYDAVAQSFSTDDLFNAPEEDVVGAPSQELRGRFKIFVGRRNYASMYIDKMLEEAGLEAENKYFLPAITAGTILTRDEMENGVALIEMGAGVSSVSIYLNGIMRFYYSIPFGGKSVTEDIKNECGFSRNLAENIKMGFGACMPDKLQTMSEKILQIYDEEDGTNQQLSVKYLSEIVTGRMSEIIEALLFKIQESGLAEKLRCGIVFTGGGAELDNACAFIKQMSGYNVRKGYSRSKNISLDACAGITEPSAVSSVAMLAAAAADFINGRQMGIEAQETEETEAQEEEQNFGGTVFDQDAGKVDEGVDNPYVHKPRPDGKPKKPKGVISWMNRLKVTKALGTMFDEMENEN